MEFLVNIKTAAKMLGVDPSTLRNWDKSNKLKPVRTKGGHRRYKLSDLEKMQEEEAS